VGRSEQGALIRDLRQRAGLTQREVAERAGLSIGGLRDLEQGRVAQPRPATLRRLATALALPPSEAEALVRQCRSDPAGARGLRVGVLGPLSVLVDGADTDPGSPTQRTLLGLLALSPNLSVDAAVLIEAAWGADMPNTPIDTLRVRISRLRQRLEPRPAATRTVRSITATTTGYQLTVGEEEHDLLMFRGLVRRARLAVRQDQLTAAFEHFAEATALRRGSTLADLTELRVNPVVVAIEREWQAAVVEFADVAAAIGQHAEVVPLLRQITEAEPLHEPAHARLMTALATSGHQAAALRLFDGLRRRLADELGVGPDDKLTGIHQAILRSDHTATAEARPATPPPAHLPHATAAFTGRADQLAALDGLLDTGAGGLPLAVISGTAGVGKTTLALHWAHRIRDRFPDGQLYIDLRGFDKDADPVAPADAVYELLEALGTPPEQIPAGLTARVGLYRSTLAGKRILLVLDNARYAAQIRPLLPGAASCLTLATSRNQLVSLVAAEGAHLVALEPLTGGEARALLAGRLGRARVDAEPDAVDEIIARCARLPLALAIVAARAVTRATFPLTTIATALSGPDRNRLVPLFGAGAATDVRAAFSWSYRILTPPAARLFRLLGLHPGPDIGLPAAASLAGICPDQVSGPLAELTEAHLLSEHAPGRYQFHDLLHSYAAELAQTHDTAEERSAAQRRYLDYYLHTGHRAATIMQPHRSPITVPPPAAGVTPQDLADHTQADGWLAAEHRAVLAVIRQACDTEFDAYVWQLSWVLGNFLDRHARWDTQAAINDLAHQAALRVGDRAGQANALRGLGLADARRGRHRDAETHLQAAIELFGALGDSGSQGHTHLDLGWAVSQLDRHQLAQHHAQQAQDLFQTGGHLAGQANALNAISWCQTILGHHDQALATCGQALAVFQELGDPDGEAPAWDTLGDIYQRLGRHSEAIAAYERSLVLYRQLDNRHYEADVLDHLGDAHHANHDREEATAAWRDAHAILDDLDLPEASLVRDKLHNLHPGPGHADDAHVE